jgi:hypothetical protein
VDVSEETARMVAETIARGSEVATKSDLEATGTALRADIARLELRIERLDKDLSAKILRFFIPLWVAVFGALASMIALVIVHGP